MSAPLFVNDIETLRASLRLSGLDATSDAERVFQNAVLGVRSKLYQRLGTERVTALLAVAYTESPTSQAQATRASANMVEVMMVRRELLLSMPMLFSGGMGAAGEAWNAEAPFRDVGVNDVAAIVRTLDRDIEAGLALLASSDAFPTEDSGLHVTTIGAPCGHAPRLAANVFGGRY